MKTKKQILEMIETAESLSETFRLAFKEDIEKDADNETKDSSYRLYKYFQGQAEILKEVLQ